MHLPPSPRAAKSADLPQHGAISIRIVLQSMASNENCFPRNSRSDAQRNTVLRNAFQFSRHYWLSRYVEPFQVLGRLGVQMTHRNPQARALFRQSSPRRPP